MTTAPKKARKPRNEQTSKRVASEAGRLMRDVDKAIDVAEMMVEFGVMGMGQIRVFLRILKRCKPVIASALTQAPDKKRSRP